MPPDQRAREMVRKAASIAAAHEHARQRAEAEAERVAAPAAQLAHVHIGEAIVRGE